MRLCAHTTMIEASSEDGVVKIDMETDCEDIKHYGKLLKEVFAEDYSELKGSKIIELASEAGLTPTCMVPTAIFNACWLEEGMISKNLAMDVGQLCIHFVD